MLKLSRILSVILILIIILTNNVISFSESSVEQKINTANLYLNNLKIFNYFGAKNFNSKDLNTSLFNSGLISPKYPVFVYGSDEDASIAANAGEIKKGNEYRCLGYTNDDSLYANPKFPADYPFTSGTIIESKNFYEKPWREIDNDLIQRFLKGKSTFFDSQFLPPGKEDFFRKSIIYGIGLEDGIYFNSNMFEKSDAELINSINKLTQIIDNPNQSQRAIGFLNGNFSTMRWEELVHVIQPPTDHSWGFGILFHKTDAGDRYFTVPMVPMSLINNDLTATFEPLKCSSSSGKKVTIGVRVNSKFINDVTANFSWDITKSTDGSKVPVDYSGHANSESGSLTVPASNERLLLASFTMPESNVKIKFKINEKGDNPPENTLTNNFLEWEVKVVEKIVFEREFDLPYNVLSRDVTFPYVNGKDVKAQLYKYNNATWVGNATGSLNLHNNNTDLFGKYHANYKPDVDENSETIVRNPVINTTFDRKFLGDDPENNGWSDKKSPATIVTEGTITSEGKASRKYTYKCDSPTCEGHDGTAEADFNECTDKTTLTTYIYNGKEPKEMPKVETRDFKKVVELNTINSKKRNLFWISDPYDLKVLRWMCRLNKDGIVWVPVNGKYEREFTQQNTANITWNAQKPMSVAYSKERGNARLRKSGAQYYPNAVFATDFDLQKVKYPFKSGYYFNPLGVYTCTVETTQYKDTPDATKEHKDLVEKLINSFHFKSNIQYTSKGRDFKTLDITNKNRSIFGMNMLSIQTKPSKDVTTLKRSTDRTSEDSDRFFKEILEGYSDSNTLDSHGKYKYREYVREGNIYKVHETTVITFTISPPAGKKLYTYSKMPNGSYPVNVSADGFALDNYRYDELIINKVDSIDKISVTVHGSMYDDLYNNEH